METIFLIILSIGMVSAILHLVLIFKISTLLNNGNFEINPQFLLDIALNKVNLPEDKQYLVKLCRYNFMFGISIFIVLAILFLFIVTQTK